MDRIVKVFCSGVDQDRLAEGYSIIERYQGFVLAEVPENKVSELTKRFPIEDITNIYTIHVGESSIDTSQPRVDTKGKLRTHPAYKGVKRLSPGRHHHMVQFVGPIKEEWLREVEAAGGELRSPQEAFAYIVQANEKTLAKIAALPFVRWVGHLPHSARIAPSVMDRIGRKVDDVTSELPRTRVLPGAYAVEFFDATDIKKGVSAIKKLGFEVLDQDPKAKLVVIRDPKSGAGTAKRIRDLSAVHGVRVIRERSFKRTTNDVAARIMGTSQTAGGESLGLSGNGEVIGVCDTGLDTADTHTIHPDFAGRITSISSYPITPDLSPYINNPGGDDGAADLDSGHGTHVAGSVLGNGSASASINGIDAPIRGLAHKSKLVFQAVEQEMQWKNSNYYQVYGRYLLTGIPHDLTDLFSEAYGKKARIHSNSWGGGDPGAYDIQCEQLDRFVWEHKDFCILVANGNDGTDADGDGSINPMSVSSPATSKNCISVGACENERPNFNANTYGAWWPSDYPVAPYRSDPMANNPDQVVAFSSRGPTQDGRIKPDVVAPGTFILSTRSTMLAPNNMAWAGFPPSRHYFHMGGTSMATPLTAGAVALIREYLRKERQIRNPSAALLKASLIAGATRLPGYGTPGSLFDNEQGYGRVNLDSALAPSAPAQSEFLEVKPGLRTGELYSLQIDVSTNEIPLRVTMAYSDYPGPALVNNLNLILTAPDGTRYVGNQNTDGSLTMDVKNNVEVVHVSSPLAGAWLLEVVGSNIPRGPQDFALVYTAHIGEAPENAVISEVSAPGLPIPDNASRGVSDTITIHGSGTVSSVKVGVDIEHTYIGDLQVSLTAPNRSKILLHTRSGASADDLIKTYDVHTTPDLGMLAGSSAQGDWRLTVSDHARRDEGQLRRWNLEITLASTNTIQKAISPFLEIPDNDPNGVSSMINITDAGSLRSIEVNVDITHTWIGDLIVQLVAPSGMAVLLHDRSGGNQDNIIKSFDISSVPALQDLIGTPSLGTWTLKVSDHAGRDVGKLNRWGLNMTL